MIERIKADILCVIYWIKDSDYDAASQEEKGRSIEKVPIKRLKRMLALG